MFPMASDIIPVLVLQLPVKVMSNSKFMIEDDALRRYYCTFSSCNLRKILHDVHKPETNRARFIDMMPCIVAVDKFLATKSGADIKAPKKRRLLVGRNWELGGSKQLGLSVHPSIHPSNVRTRCCLKYNFHGQLCGSQN